MTQRKGSAIQSCRIAKPLSESAAAAASPAIAPSQPSQPELLAGPLDGAQLRALQCAAQLLARLHAEGCARAAAVEADADGPSAAAQPQQRGALRAALT